MSADAAYADLELRDRAVEALRDFASRHQLPVERTQIAGLRQIAGNEPGLLKDFLDRQRERAQKRFQSSGERDMRARDEVAFWEMVGHLCTGKPPRCPWSLDQDAEADVPAELRGEKLPAGAKLSPEERTARQKRDDQRRAFLDAWRRRVYPVFFQHFCAEYLYRKAMRPGEGDDHDGDAG
jgi:hypothetical protein